MGVHPSGTSPMPGRVPGQGIVPQQGGPMFPNLPFPQKKPGGIPFKNIGGYGGSIFNNPYVAMGIGMLGANAPSIDPRRQYIGFQLSEGLKSAQESQELVSQQSVMAHMLALRQAEVQRKQAAFLHKQKVAEEQRKAQANLATMIGQQNPAAAAYMKAAGPEGMKLIGSMMFPQPDKPLKMQKQLEYFHGLPEGPIKDMARNMLVRQGTHLSVSPEGAVSFQMGGGIPGQKPSTTMMGKIQEKQFNAGESMSRLTSIEQAYKPEYLEIPTRVGVAWDAMKEKVGANVSEEEKSQIAEFSTFKRRSLDNLNQNLREMSGAAITPQEADRLTEGLPDAGVGIFGGDSPTQFKAKMDDSIGSLKTATKRYILAQKLGLNWQSVSLDKVPELVQKYGEKLSKQYQDQGMSKEEADRLALDLLQRELGGGF